MTGGPLADLGKRLREARTKRGWSLQQVSERTHITTKHLEALEAGNVSGMPAPVYIRGFVRGYAKALDLSEEAMLQALDDAGIRPATVPVVLEPPEQPAGWRPQPQTLAIAGAVLVGGIVLGLAIRGFVRFMGSAGDGAVPASPFSTPAATARPRHAGDEGGGPEAGSIAAVKGGALVDHVAVSVTAIQECWVEAQSDQRRAHNEILKAGESRFYQGSGRVRLMIGNPAGLEVSGPFGRFQLPKKAPRGVHLLFTRQGVEPLEVPLPSATAAADSAPTPHP